MKIHLVKIHPVAAALAVAVIAAAWPIGTRAASDGVPAHRTSTQGASTQGTSSQGTAARGQCLATYYQGSNGALLTGYSEKAARENAILSWGVRVTASVGPLYGDWDLAADRSFRCVSKGRLIKCTARARPCESR